MVKFNQIAMAVMTAGAMIACTAANAATTTFAQFVQAMPSARIFTYSNVSSGTTTAQISTVAGSTAYLVSSLGSLASPSAASVNLTASSMASPTMSDGQISQLFSGSLTFTLLAPQIGTSGSSVNALRVDFVNALLLASPGGSALTLQANSDAGSSIAYYSDFSDLSWTNAQDFAFSFSGSTVPLNIRDGRLPNFRTSGSGTFAASTPVPEPTSWAMMMAGFGFLGFAMRRNRPAPARLA